MDLQRGFSATCTPPGRVMDHQEQTSALRLQGIRVEDLEQEGTTSHSTCQLADRVPGLTVLTFPNSSLVELVGATPQRVPVHLPVPELSLVPSWVKLMEALSPPNLRLQPEDTRNIWEAPHHTWGVPQVAPKVLLLRPTCPKCHSKEPAPAEALAPLLLHTRAASQLPLPRIWAKRLHTWVWGVGSQLQQALAPPVQRQQLLAPALQGACLTSASLFRLALLTFRSSFLQLQVGLLVGHLEERLEEHLEEERLEEHRLTSLNSYLEGCQEVHHPLLQPQQKVKAFSPVSSNSSLA
mmetsp:Transcript_2773/g.6435  ORF Transcript_2773/g.6435 Transcript_2773/m.6435 type:complete len:295 (+) Transcript_2773:1085-1969(+)